eukprot:6259725-Pyramimonas_sp.AAC.2
MVAHALSPMVAEPELSYAIEKASDKVRNMYNQAKAEASGSRRALQGAAGVHPRRGRGHRREGPGRADTAGAGGGH